MIHDLISRPAVPRQSMTLAEFAEYFETCTKPGQAILNMISLEFRCATANCKLTRQMNEIPESFDDTHAKRTRSAR